jgi:hypothetical protein
MFCMKQIVIFIVLLLPLIASQPSLPRADVVEVKVAKVKEGYRFGVGIKSQETGCEQYANWWEVLNAEGRLRYRRILVHSHPKEQPFLRWGEVIDIDANETLYIRAHMFPSGYVGDVFEGSIAKGFTKRESLFIHCYKLETLPPQPKGCLY